jgi:AmmeMemoRadiSam system protein A
VTLPPPLTPDQKRVLLALALSSVHAQVTGTPCACPDLLELPDASGVFVTIKRRGELRGCLGTLENRDGLAAEISRYAAESASRDPRFSPVALDELSELSLEISVLGPLERIDAQVPDAFTIGVHGLVVERGTRRGLLLPQVAVEWGWTREEFLCQTCVKARLPRDAWRGAALVYRFGAEVFGD